MEVRAQPGRRTVRRALVGLAVVVGLVGWAAVFAWAALMVAP
jgi:hypothetical protein